MAIIYARLELSTEEVGRLYQESNEKSHVVFDTDSPLNAFDRLVTAIVREWVHKREDV